MDTETGEPVLGCQRLPVAGLPLDPAAVVFALEDAGSYRVSPLGFVGGEDAVSGVAGRAAMGRPGLCRSPLPALRGLRLIIAGTCSVKTSSSSPALATPTGHLVIG
ncbi:MULTISPECIES: hypothetical protein [unclassified Streptomyces]|uniref:hypothetical protein n=1 Tax=unclassified Streptomyces TaxID=2593676 RepID=UPI003413EC98